MSNHRLYSWIFFGILGLIAVLFLEVMVHGVLLSPLLLPYLPQSLSSFSKQYYFRQRRVPQFEEGLSCYDSELFYTLCPGSHTLSNKEFTNTYSVNSKGLRDSESALIAPEIIVLGDSYALGLGVDQHQTFPALLQKLSGMKVLNAGISSYGTVRELMMLNRLDTSGLRFLVIQYCANDLIENATYKAKGNRLPIRSREEFRDQLAAQGSIFSHYFTLDLLRKGWKLVSGGETHLDEKAPGNESDVNLFLNALMNVPTKDLSHVITFVLEASSGPRRQSVFLPALEKSLASEAGLASSSRFRPLLPEPEWTEQDYYVLDDHWTASGHQKAAEALNRALSQVR